MLKMIRVDNIDYTTLYNGAQELVDMYRQELETQKVNASGSLSDTATFDFDFNENNISLYFILNSYYWYLEKGRKGTGGGAGQKWPNPVGDIEQWIRNKISRGYWVPRANQTIPHTDNEVKRVAYGILHKIHTKGYTGYHILEYVLNKAEATGLLDKMVQSVVSAYDDEVQVELNKF